MLTACAPSPTSTYTGPSGQQVTVDWADYPGAAGIDASDVLVAPTQEQAERIAETLLTDLERTLTDDYGLTWETRQEGGWSSVGGNGYGGDSSYVTYNSDSRESTDAPAEKDEWRRIVQIVSDLGARHGLNPMVLEHDRDYATPTWLQENYATTDPEDFWWWSGTSEQGAQWLSVTLTDTDQDADRKRAEQSRELGLPEQSIHLLYGVTTIEDSHRAAFRAALAPFDGLDRPAPTQSD